MECFQDPEQLSHCLERHLQKISSELDQVVEFWLQHSHDDEYGGFFSCLGRDGRRYDNLKYGWLQGRQIWTYSRLYSDVDRFRRPEILEAAEKGAQFVMKHLNDPASGKCYFVVTREGRPVKMQRTVFTECFYTMGLLALARASKKDKYKVEALEMFNRIIHWVEVDDSALGRPKLSGAPPVNTMHVPWLMLGLIQELEALDPVLGQKHSDRKKKSIRQLLQHVQRDGEAVMETVAADGSELPGSEGRLMCPGSAIEVGWFLLVEATKTNDEQLRDKAINHFIHGPFTRGWDKTNGGLFYFLDADGHSPTQLEWSMKLWWPHCEAMNAYLMAYQSSEDSAFLRLFDTVSTYCFSKFSDPDYGEWYGYLDKENRVNQDFKAGPFKGCFHVPRALMMCERMLKEILTTIK